MMVLMMMMMIDKTQTRTHTHTYIIHTKHYPHAVTHSALKKGLLQPVTPPRSKQTLGMPMSARNISPNATFERGAHAFFIAPRATVYWDVTDHVPASPGVGPRSYLSIVANTGKIGTFRKRNIPVSGWTPLGTSMLRVGVELALAHSTASPSSNC
jgi:hypothetical protein